MSTVDCLVAYHPPPTTQQHCWIHVNTVRIFFSYSTPVAFYGCLGYEVRCARLPRISQTTERHMRAADVAYFPVIENRDRFNETLNRCIYDSFVFAVTKKMIDIKEPA